MIGASPRSASLGAGRALERGVPEAGWSRLGIDLWTNVIAILLVLLHLEVLGRIKGQELARAPTSPAIHLDIPPGIAIGLHRLANNGDARTAGQRADQCSFAIGVTAKIQAI